MVLIIKGLTNLGPVMAPFILGSWQVCRDGIIHCIHTVSQAVCKEVSHFTKSVTSHRTAKRPERSRRLRYIQGCLLPQSASQVGMPPRTSKPRWLSGFCIYALWRRHWHLDAHSPCISKHCIGSCLVSAQNTHSKAPLHTFCVGLSDLRTSQVSHGTSKMVLGS